MIFYSILDNKQKIDLSSASPSNPIKIYSDICSVVNADYVAVLDVPIFFTYDVTMQNYSYVYKELCNISCDTDVNCIQDIQDMYNKNFFLIHPEFHLCSSNSLVDDTFNTEIKQDELFFFDLYKILYRNGFNCCHLSGDQYILFRLPEYDINDTIEISYYNITHFEAGNH